MARAINRANKIYEVAALFAEQCLLKDGSLLWSGRGIWTLENLDSLWRAFIQQPDTTDKSFIEKWSEQLRGQSEDVFRLATEAAALYCLFPYYKQMGPVSKKKLIEEVRTMGPELGAFDERRWLNVESALDEDGIARAGADYNTRRPFHIGYYLAFALEVKRRGLNSLSAVAPIELVDTVLDWASEDMAYRPNGSRNAVLHLFWPEDFEPSASNTHKQKMAENLSAHFGLNPLDDTDETIRQARRHMESNGFENNFDMYDDEYVRHLWDIKPGKKKRGNTPGSADAETPERDGSTTTPDSVSVTTVATISDLAAETHFTKAYLREIEDLLHDKKQLIFEGPPGSGKTFVAEKIARYITGQPLNSPDRNEQVEMIQFHQSYSYEDFVEGIRPITNDDGQLVYAVKPGIFRRFADTAHKNPDKKFVLIIDEINRGNVSRILGELMLLLEYRNQTATLQYSQDALQIPNNLYIIGTMNSADRSLSQIDYALRRRFYFVRFMSVESGEAPALQGWLGARGVDPTQSVDLFVRLNERIRQHMHTDDLQVGHSYFMRPDISDPQVLEQVWKYAVMPLLREYFYHQRNRDELLQGFELEQLNARPADIDIDSVIPAVDADDE